MSLEERVEALVDVLERMVGQMDVAKRDDTEEMDERDDSEKLSDSEELDDEMCSEEDDDEASEGDSVRGMSLNEARSQESSLSLADLSELD